MENVREFVGISLLIFGLLLYFVATDPFIGKTDLVGEKTVFKYKFSKYDPIIHKIFVDIKADGDVEALIVNKMFPEGREAFEFNGDEIQFVKTAHRGEVWTLTLYNKAPAPVIVEYDARITCYSYVYGGIILTALGFFTLICENIKKRSTGQRS
ncbi:MAG: hypothetical protein ACE5J5_00740 [Candidatus Hydrothermarchaeales archaeon]